MPRLRLRLWWAEPSSSSRSHSAAAQTQRLVEKLPKLPCLLLFMYLTLSSRTPPHSAVHRARRSMLDWRLGGMASAVFEGTSLVNMFVRDCWVNGIRRLIISQSGEEEEFFEIRTEWSDRNILYLHRSYSDLGRLFRRLVESFPEDRRDLSKSPLIEGWCDSG